MNLTVTQDNLYLFLPSKISWVAEMLSEDKNICIERRNLTAVPSKGKHH